MILKIYIDFQSEGQIPIFKEVRFFAILKLRVVRVTQVLNSEQVLITSINDVLSLS